MITKLAKILVFCYFFYCCNTSATTYGEYNWVQFNSEGKLEHRYIQQDSCKDITRSSPDKNNESHICYFANLNKTHIPVSNNPKIVIVADSGCSEKKHDQICDKKNWPFAEIVNTIKSKEKYDYLIHLGDFRYDPNDFSLARWKKEFLEPALPILDTAPWIFVRGNHEDCRKGFKGWYKLFDPFPYNDQCKDSSLFYTLKFGKYQFIVMDNSSAYDIFKKAPINFKETGIIKQYAEEFQKIDAQVKKAKNEGITSIILMHKPLYGIDADENGEYAYNVTMQSTALTNFADNVELILSGHVHAWEALSTKNKINPPQIIVGNSGNSLIKHKPRKFSSKQEIIKNTGLDLDQFYGNINFGYATLELLENKILVDFKDISGKKFKSCIVKNRILSCQYGK